jgi:hypothetical protein
MITLRKATDPILTLRKLATAPVPAGYPDVARLAGVAVARDVARVGDALDYVEAITETIPAGARGLIRTDFAGNDVRGIAELFAWTVGR